MKNTKFANIAKKILTVLSMSAVFGGIADVTPSTKWQDVPPNMEIVEVANSFTNSTLRSLYDMTTYDYKYTNGAPWNVTSSIGSATITNMPSETSSLVWGMYDNDTKVGLRLTILTGGRATLETMSLQGDSWTVSSSEYTDLVTPRNATYSIVFPSGATATRVGEMVLYRSGTLMSFAADATDPDDRHFEIAIGAGAEARNAAISSSTIAQCVALGLDAKAIGTGTTAVGARSTATNNVSVAFGYASDANGKGSVALGGGANTDHRGPQANGEYSLAIGHTRIHTNATPPSAVGERSIAIGTFEPTGVYSEIPTTANGSKSIAIGAGAVANADGAVQIGTGTNDAQNALQFMGVPIADNFGVGSTINRVAGTESLRSGLINLMEVESGDVPLTLPDAVGGLSVRTYDILVKSTGSGRLVPHIPLGAAIPEAFVQNSSDSEFSEGTTRFRLEQVGGSYYLTKTGVYNTVIPYETDWTEGYFEMEVTAQPGDWVGSWFIWANDLSKITTAPTLKSANSVLYVDWGDGSPIESYTTNNCFANSSKQWALTNTLSHTYAAAGTYSLKISNDMGVFFRMTNSTEMVTLLKSWSQDATTLSFAFHSYRGLSNATLPPWPVKATALNNCFMGCSGLTLATLPAWPATLRVVNNCYANCSNIVADNIPEWPNSITALTSCFQGCENLVGNSIPSWPPNIVSAAQCYQFCSNLVATSLPNWPYAVTNINNVFFRCAKITAPMPPWPEKPYIVVNSAYQSSGVTTNAWMYSDITTNPPTRADDSILMPSYATKFDFAVGGTTPVVLRDLFLKPWGGTRKVE